MKKHSARRLYRRLTLLLALALTLGALTTPADAYSEWTECGEAYVVTSRTCIFWGWYCWEEQQGCANCKEGVACFQMY